MKYIGFDNEKDAFDKAAQVTDMCLANNKWTDGITNSYCIPYHDVENNRWLIPILPSYENFFTEEENLNSFYLT